MSNKIEIVTGEVRLSYCHLFEPVLPMGSQPGAKERYSVCLLIDKEDTNTINSINKAVQNALEDGKSKKFGGKIPKVWRNPLRDGDDKDLEKNPEYEGCYFINCNSFDKPDIVNKFGKPIISASDLKSGDYANVAINFYPYAASGNNGVGCSVVAVMKTRDGEPLGGARTTAASAFAGMFEEEDDLI